MQPSQIPSEGTIPDRRGLNNRFDGPAVAPADVQVIARHVAGQVYVIAGAGGNIAVQAGDDGLLLVDNNFQVFYDQIMARIRQISDKPIRIVVNTHSHPDHVQNNANLSRQGALIFAHPNTRAALMRQGQSPAPASGGAAASGVSTGGNVPFSVFPAGWPTITTAETMTFHFNGEDVLFVPLKSSHTNGDVAVYFTRSNVWVFGDVYTTDYPAMGVEQGGTVENFIDNYNKALEMTNQDTIFLPGHGQLSRRADLIANRDAISTIHERFVKMVSQGMTLEQIRAARPSKEFDARYATENLAPNDLQNSTRWYEQMFNEARAHLNAR